MASWRIVCADQAGLALDLPNTSAMMNIFGNVTSELAANVEGIQKTMDNNVENMYYAIGCQVVTVIAVAIGFVIAYVLNHQTKR